MSDNFCKIFDHGMDLELRNFVRNLLVLVANYRKSRIEKEKKITHGFATKLSHFLFVCFLGVGYVSIMVSFVIMIRKSLIQMQVINSLYIFVHPHLPVKYHCTYTWVDISSVKTKERGTGSQKHTGLRSSGVLILLRDRQVRRYCDGRLENCIEKFMSGLNF